MSQVWQKIRSKRFVVKKDELIELQFEMPTGETVTAKVTNVSNTGLVVLTKSNENDATLNGSIVSNAVLKAKDFESNLGRLSARHVKVIDDHIRVGFSLVDGRLNLQSISHLLDASLDDLGKANEYELYGEPFDLSTFKARTNESLDLFARCREFNLFLKEWRTDPIYKFFRVREPSKGVRVNLTMKRSEGRRNDFLMFGSNDYLGLASHPLVEEAAIKAIKEYGFGSTGSAVSSGVSRYHEELEALLASVFNKESCLLFNSGYAANVGCISSICDAEDLILFDFLSHASLQDGMAMSSAHKIAFKHNDMVHLEQLLQEHRQQYRGSLIITEGVFSMDGDVPPLPEIVQQSQKYKCRLLVDEAHSFGVIGPTGLGAAEKYGLIDSTDIIMGTFSKIVGGIGGFLCAEKDIINWFRHYARSYVFSVSIPPSTAAAALAGVKLFLQDKSLLENLRNNINHFAQGLRELGAKVPLDHESSVFRVTIGNEKKLSLMAKTLFDAGIYVVPVTYPAVSRNKAGFRFTCMATHSITELDYALNVLEKAMLKAQFNFDELNSYVENVKLVKKIA